jgi:hypothetical protein
VWFVAGRVEPCVRPLTEQCLDEALGLSVRLRAPRSGAAVLDREFGACVAEAASAEGAAVVGVDQEACGGGGALVGQHLGVGDAAVVVDRDVDVVVAGAGFESTASPSQQPVAGPVEARLAA